MELTKMELIRFKRIYNFNVTRKRERFTFKGTRIYTEYAKYMIKYLETKFKKETI